jgi:hypothetical protein
MEVGSPYKIALFSYWLFCLIVGTAFNFLFTYKYIRHLPEWTQINITPDPLEDDLPSPEETEVHHLWRSNDNNHEILQQPFTNPAVLQANEAGSLVRVRRGTNAYIPSSPYLRTRHVYAIGFEVPMNDNELRQERAELLDWVAKNKARSRHRTLSIPHFFKVNPGTSYGSIASEEESEEQHRRSQTLGGYLHFQV